MGSTKRKFDIKLNAATIKVARLALAHAQTDTGPTGPLKQLREGRAIPGRLSLEVDEANELHAALLLYADQEVREGSDSHKIATEFAAALGDFVDTKVVAEAVPAIKELGETLQKINEHRNRKLVGGAIPVTEEFERRLKKKRDAIFREIVGKPAELTIWGTPKKAEEPNAKARVPASTQRNRVRTLDGVVHTRGSAPRERLTSVVDKDCDDALTQGRVPAYNEQMKREGAEALMVNKTAGAGDGVVVGSVGDYEKRLRAAQRSGDVETEVAALSEIWNT